MGSGENPVTDLFRLVWTGASSRPVPGKACQKHLISPQVGDPAPVGCTSPAPQPHIESAVLGQASHRTRGGGSATGESPVARGQARPPGAQKTAFGTVPWLFGVHRGGILVPWGHLDFRLFDRPEVIFGRPDRPRATSSGQSVCRDRVCIHRAAGAQERHVFST